MRRTNIGQCFGKRVRVYWNLHKKCWSVMDKKTRRVIAHTDQVTLCDVRFVVSEPGRQRVIKEQRKNVHAFADGILGFPHSPFVCGRTVSYNPYKAGTFMEKGTDRPVHNAPYAQLTNRVVTIP